MSSVKDYYILYSLNAPLDHVLVPVIKSPNRCWPSVERSFESVGGSLRLWSAPAVCIAWNARSHFGAKALNHCKSCPIGGQFDAGWIAHGVKEDDDT